MSGFTETPKHVAIIMDGNGRWAERRGRPRIFGHVRGCARVRDIIREADRQGVKALTLYAFSSENWGRPSVEVSVLMRLLYKWLIRERREMMDKSIRLRAIGAVDRLPESVRKMLTESIGMSKDNTGLQLTLAVSYSGRDELTQVAQRLARRVAAGELAADDIGEHHFAEELSTAPVGDPDLLIRTSGEQRISNFLLWQMAYTELYFTDTMWPDFKPSDLRMAIDSFTRRQRRFGLTARQAEEARV
ncbi:MAG: isoprenyl transferase [Deltaproteobacteria bacterium]|nr:isoprenyl transferase [Deltaproteobacteria bacterium]